jgi:aspartate aminotransferase
MLSKKIQLINPSLTLAITQKAAEMRAQGIDVISLAAGEPDFTTPTHVKEAAHLAIDRNLTYYTPVDGLPALKDAICLKLARDQKIEYTHQEVIACNGAKQAIFNLCYSLLDPEDEVIFSAPYWVSYPDIVVACSGTPVIVPTGKEERFLLTARLLEKAITPKTKLVILNSPANPSGQIYTKEELSAIADVLIHHPNIFICTDDIYETITWNRPFINILNVAPELKPRTIIINGLSKSHAMTGWRLGYAAGDKTLIKAMKTIQSQTTSNPCSISQAAAITALSQPCPELLFMQQEYQRRHDLLIQQLKNNPYFEPIPADGSFYLWINVEKAIAHLELTNDMELANYLLQKAHVAVIPGIGFGTPGYIRISFTTDALTLINALQRINQALLIPGF